MEKRSVLIKNGTVIDGSGAPAFNSDVYIRDGSIEKIGPKLDAAADIEIDASGLYVSPGFIDGHAHNDGYMFHDPTIMSKLSQGVTTEISGNCGEALVPVTDKHFDEIFDYYKTYYPQSDFSDYKDYQYFFEQVEKLKLGINTGFYCGHGTMRMAAMGFENRPPSKWEMDQMKSYLIDGLDQGCFGMSTGLIYSPGCFSTAEELIELCKILKDHDAVYTSHIRNEGFNLIKSVEEVISIAKATGVRTIISHLKVLGAPYWGKSEKVLEMIEAANDEGCEIYFDQYPYSYSCTVLYSILPIEYTEGGITALMEKLSKDENREKLKEMYLNDEHNWDNPIRNYGYDGIHILTAEGVPEAEGKTLSEYAGLIGEDPLDALFKIILTSGSNSLAAFDCMCEKDIKRIMKHKLGSIGSDGIAVFPGEKTHPRLFGSFPRVLKKYVLDENLLALPEAIHKMTSLTAGAVGLNNKGLIREGYDADITIFDLDKLEDRASLAHPQKKAAGIEYVIVSGDIALKDGNYMDKNLGKLLKKKGK